MMPRLPSCGKSLPSWLGCRWSCFFLFVCSEFYFILVSYCSYYYCYYYMQVHTDGSDDRMLFIDRLVFIRCADREN